MLRKCSRACWLGSLILLLAGQSASGQGIIVPSAGPINSAMAGASTAAPVDFGGSYWNPAILSGLDEPEVLIGSALAFPSIHLESWTAAGSVGGVFPHAEPIWRGAQQQRGGSRAGDRLLIPDDRRLAGDAWAWASSDWWAAA